MSTLDNTLETLSQRTGSSSGALETTAERILFQDSARTDIAAIVGQLNSVYFPLVDTLSKVTGLDALDFGLSGNVIFAHVNATAADASLYYDSTTSRARTIKESFDVLLSEISRLENEIDNNTSVVAYDDTAVVATGSLNSANLSQLRTDTQGDQYTLDGDGAANLTYSLAQHIDAIGAFFSGFPGTGNTYTPSYPAVSLAVNVSDLIFDTTISGSNITNLDSHISAVMAFTGMDTALDTAPAYSSNKIVTDATSLETAVGALDTAISFSTTGGVTSNAVGAEETDSFVFGSDQLNHDGAAAHYTRMLFDKSNGSFRVGRTTTVGWDTRGAGSFCAGVDNVASADHSTTLGTGNLNAGEGCSILGGGSGTGANTILTPAADSTIVGGGSNTIDRSITSVIAGGINHTIGDGVTPDVGCGILSGSGAIIDGGSLYAVVCGGGNGAAGSGGEIRNASSRSIIGAGRDNAIGTTLSSSESGIFAGYTNTIDGGAANVVLGGVGNVTNTAVSSAILAGQLNTIDSASAYALVAVGTDHTISSSDRSLIGGGDTNTITSSNSAAVLVADSSSITSSNSSVVLNGTTQVVLNGSANVVGGTGTNTITDGIGCVALGSNHTVTSATGASIPGGTNNTVTENNAMAVGTRAHANHEGTIAHANGRFATDGDAQGEIAIWRGQTTDATPTEIFLDGSALQYIMDDSSTYALNFMVVGRQTGGAAGTVGDSIFEEIKAAVEVTAGVPAGIPGGSQSTVANSAGAAAWTAVADFDVATDALRLTVTGEASKDINWVATCRIVKVSG